MIVTGEFNDECYATSKGDVDLNDLRSMESQRHSKISKDTTNKEVKTGWGNGSK